KPEKADEGEKKDEPKPEAPKGEGEKAEKGEKKEGDGEKKDDAKPKVDYGKRWAESIRFEVKPLPIPDLPAGKNDGMFGPEDRSILPAPDGRKVLFVRGLGDVILLDLTKKEARRVLEGWNEPEVQWASDSRHIVFAREDTDFNSDIWLMDTGESKAEPVNLTRHPDSDDSPQLSADGKVLYFRSERAGDNGDFDVWYVTLDRTLDGLRPYELEEHFKKAADAAKKRKPIDAVVWDGADPVPAAKARPALKFDGAADAYNRARRLTTFPGSEGNLAITPGGDRVLFSATPPPTDAPATPPAAGAAPAAPTRTLFNVSYKGDDRKTVTTGALSGVTVSLTGERVSWVSGGGASWAPSGGGKTDALPIDAPVVIDVAAQQRQKFLEGARLLGNGFYHPTLKGLPWVKLTNEYLSLAERTRTNEEFDRVFMMLLNELDGSHLGINSPGGFSAASPATGYLGVDVQPVAGGYKVVRVINDSPADKEATRLFVGDVITAVDGKALGAQGQRPSVDFIAALAGRAGKETLLELDRADKARSKMLIIVPTSNGEDSTLRYKHEVARRREIVEKASGGRLGYLHIRGMDQASVLEFERDLYAAANGKEGLIIDVRDNGGGSTADILLSSLTAPRHAYTANRGVDVSSVPKDAYPRDRRLIYGYSRPISVLINENSYSNAEIFAHSIKTIGRGKLVGVATFGAVISTGAATLIDGATVRTPFRGWYLPDGTDMEVRGAQPDVPVVNTPADEAAGKDTQLETAVQELLGRVGK
ncbi:MAG: PD40 domain-containing protein, partial [Phycisphaerae bacterium]|nr:PD40 domain-containing protein [Phycisphaerae bacterium]